MAKPRRTPPAPSLVEILAAREQFKEVEPRDLFYRAATELVRLAHEGAVNISVAESLAVLLQTWNVTFYRFKPMDDDHLTRLSELLQSNEQELTQFRGRKIESLTDSDAPSVQKIFGDFANLLGPVGAAKSLHLLAPWFFPLWDNEIACGYGCRLSKPRNAERYWTFTRHTKAQIDAMGAPTQIPDPLKALDEYNYCRFTVPMLEKRKTAKPKQKP